MALTILEGSTFCMSDETGDLNGDTCGFFADDTRFLSRFQLTINGERTPNDKAYYSTFASVDTSSGRVRIIPGSVVDYVVVNEHDVIAMDGSGNLSSVDLDTGRATLLAKQAPVCCMTGRPHFATSGDGHVWFGMEGNPAAGPGGTTSSGCAPGDGLTHPSVPMLTHRLSIAADSNHHDEERDE